MEVDPMASMRCWAIDVALGGRTFEVPALPAVDWWPILTTGDVTLILDMVESSDGQLDEVILSRVISMDSLTTALTDVIEEVAGRSFRASVVIASVANSQWATINGVLARSGFRWDKQPLGAALDAVYAVITSRLEGDTLAEFLRLLDDEKAPATRGRQRRAQASEQFAALAGPPPTTGVVATSEQSGSGRPRTRPRSLPRPPGARSVGPTTPRAPRVGSGLPANSATPGGVGEPTSDTVPPPPPA